MRCGRFNGGSPTGIDLQMLVASARGVARGTVARLVAAGERNTHEWTKAKRRDDGRL